ncbi:MAG: DUF3592 domain-containing protein [Phycisphaerales bacterium]
MFKKPWFRLLLGVVFVVIGLGAALGGGLSAWKQVKSAKWPTVPGTVVGADVETKSGRRGRTDYIARVRYEYQVNGARQVGDRVTVTARTFSSESAAQRELAKYSVGAPVTVAHDPSNPAYAVLETGAKASAFFGPGMGLVMVVIGALTAVMAKRAMAAAGSGNADAA